MVLPCLRIPALLVDVFDVAHDVGVQHRAQVLVLNVRAYHSSNDDNQQFYSAQGYLDFHHTGAG